MNTLTAALAAAAAGAVMVTGCAGTPAPPGPPPSGTVTVTVVDLAGLPVAGAEVVTRDLDSGTEHGPTLTGDNGVAAVTLPVPVTTQVGVRKATDGAPEPPTWRWQTPILLTGNTAVTYRYHAASTILDCPVADPTDPDRCP